MILPAALTCNCSRDILIFTQLRVFDCLLKYRDRRRFRTILLAPRASKQVQIGDFTGLTFSSWNNHVGL